MTKILRILELTWLVIFVVSAGFGCWRWYNEGLPCALWFFILALIAGIAYLVRRKQRLSMQQHN